LPSGQEELFLPHYYLPLPVIQANANRKITTGTEMTEARINSLLALFDPGDAGITSCIGLLVGLTVLGAGVLVKVGIGVSIGTSVGIGVIGTGVGIGVIGTGVGIGVIGTGVGIGVICTGVGIGMKT
jgi:hypothetical protein